MYSREESRGITKRQKVAPKIQKSPYIEIIKIVFRFGATFCLFDVEKYFLILTKVHSFLEHVAFASVVE